MRLKSFRSRSALSAPMLFGCPIRSSVIAAIYLSASWSSRAALLHARPH
jgi:hypothetical protein